MNAGTAIGFLVHPLDPPDKLVIGVRRWEVQIALNAHAVFAELMIMIQIGPVSQRLGIEADDFIDRDEGFQRMIGVFFASVFEAGTIVVEDFAVQPFGEFSQVRDFKFLNPQTLKSLNSD